MDYTVKEEVLTGDKFETIVKLLIYILAITTLLWHLYFAWYLPTPRVRHTIISVGAVLFIFYLMALDFEELLSVENAVTVFFLVIIPVTTAYFVLNYGRIEHEVSILLNYNNTDLVFGTSAILIALHSTLRAYGKVLPLVAILFILYGFLGPYMPGILYHGGFSVEEMIFNVSIQLTGVYGFISQIGATWIILLIFYAGFVSGYGGLDVLVDGIIGHAQKSNLRSSIVQTSVVASGVVGSIMGASASNAATTGSITIPLMKRNGIEPKVAAAIESISSTGGQVLPPVMGTAAFLMADITGISYSEIILSAALPALLYFIPLMFLIHSLAIKNDWASGEIPPMISKTERSDSWIKQKVRWVPYVTSLLILIYALTLMNANPMIAGIYGIATLVALTPFQYAITYGRSLDTTLYWLNNTIRSAKEGIEIMAPLTAVLALLGIIVEIVTSTGIGSQLAILVLDFSDQSVVIILLIIMITSITFGLGLPTSPAYILVAIIAAPALVNAGIEELTSHMFVFYFAVLSTITPPVAVTCAVAAGIAESDFLQTSFMALRFSVGIFLLPFVFVFNQQLLFWEFPRTPIIFFTLMVGFVFLLWGIFDHDVTSELEPIRQGLYIALGLVTMFAPLLAVQVGAAFVLLLIFAAYRTSKSGSKPATV